MIFLAIILSKLAEKRGKKIYILFLILVLSLFVGLRSNIVGPDTLMYYQIFGNLTRNIYSPSIELEFLVLCQFFLRFISVEWLIMLFAIVTNGLIICRLWSLKDRGSFMSMVIIYIVLYYPQTANIIRQYMAIALVFYGTKYLEDKKNLRFFLTLALAFCCHRTALLGVLYYPLQILVGNKNNGRKQKMLLMSAVLFPIVVTYFLSRIRGDYSKYLLTANNNIGFLYPAELLTIILFLLLSYKSIKLYEDLNTFIWFKRLLITYVIGILLSSAGYFQSSLYRMGLYFIIFDTIYIPYVSSKGTNKKIFRLIYSLFIAYMTVTNHLSGWSGLLEYSTWI